MFDHGAHQTQEKKHLGGTLVCFFSPSQTLSVNYYTALPKSKCRKCERLQKITAYFELKEYSTFIFQCLCDKEE